TRHHRGSVRAVSDYGRLPQTHLPRPRRHRTQLSEARPETRHRQPAQALLTLAGMFKTRLASLHYPAPGCSSRFHHDFDCFAPVHRTISVWHFVEADGAVEDTAWFDA